MTRIAAVACFVALVAVGAWSAVREVDSTAHDAYAGEVRHLEALDAELAEQLVLSRSGLVADYDRLARTTAALERCVSTLEEPPAFVREDRRAELLDKVRAVREVLGREETLVEQFETHNAVLRNSVRFFPIAATELLQRDSGDAARQAHLEAQALLFDVVLFTNVTDSDVLARLEERLRNLRDTAGAAGATADPFAVVRMHAEVIAQRKPIVDALTHDILALPAAARAEELDATYARVHGEAVQAASERRTVLFLLALATVAFAAAHVVQRTRRAAHTLRETTEKLSQALDAQKELSVLKTRFVSMASHEFRTPLSAILSSAELLAAYGEQWSEEKKAEHFARINGAVKNMAQLLDRILLVGRSETGMLTFQPAEMSLAGFCADLVETTRRTTGDSRTIDFVYAGPTSHVRMDEKLLGHILGNLLSNALKYSDDEVRFEVRAEGDDVVFVVRDRGIGIPEEDRARLFETFQRARNVGTIPGTGLGLAIVKASADLHGGTIVVDSAVGQGTTFTVTLPQGKT